MNDSESKGTMLLGALAIIGAFLVIFLKPFGSQTSVCFLIFCGSYGGTQILGIDANLLVTFALLAVGAFALYLSMKEETE